MVIVTKNWTNCHPWFLNTHNYMKIISMEELSRRQNLFTSLSSLKKFPNKLYKKWTIVGLNRHHRKTIDSPETCKPFFWTGFFIRTMYIFLLLFDHKQFNKNYKFNGLMRNLRFTSFIHNHSASFWAIKTCFTVS